MDLIKKLTGKNPSEYEVVAKNLVNNSDTDLFKKLIDQDDFLFDFIKNNVSKRIMHACDKYNYKNLLNFFEYYSPSYDMMIAEVLHNFGGDSIFDEIKNIYLKGSDSQKAYAVKYFTIANEGFVRTIIDELRKTAKSDYEPLAANSIEALARLNDDVSKNEAILSLNSDDEFEVLNAVRFLSIYGAKDSLNRIIEIMKHSSFSENIAAEIPYIMPLLEMFENNRDNAILTCCYIINAIPDILPLSSVQDYEIGEFLEMIMSQKLDSQAAILLKIAKDKFEELCSNEEYFFDSDKNTKEELKKIHQMLINLNDNKLKSLIYDELFEESDLVFFAVDFADDKEELETLLESSNQTLILKVLERLKELGMLENQHKEKALKNVSIPEISAVVTVL